MQISTKKFGHKVPDKVRKNGSDEVIESALTDPREVK
jgi:hypothetical protein